MFSAQGRGNLFRYISYDLQSCGRGPKGPILLIGLWNRSGFSMVFQDVRPIVCNVPVRHGDSRRNVLQHHWRQTHSASWEPFGHEGRNHWTAKTAVLKPKTWNRWTGTVFPIIAS